MISQGFSPSPRFLEPSCRAHSKCLKMINLKIKRFYIVRHKSNKIFHNLILKAFNTATIWSNIKKPFKTFSISKTSIRKINLKNSPNYLKIAQKSSRTHYQTRESSDFPIGTNFSLKLSLSSNYHSSQERENFDKA